MHLKNKKIQVIDLGLIDYKEAWDYQETLLKEIVDGKMALRMLEEQGEDTSKKQTKNYLLICEHPHVYTLGKSGHPEYLLANDKKLKEINATFYKINRGGDITYHGPGQLVIYPIIDLDNFFTDIHKYLRFLEEVVINVLADYDIAGERFNGYTGVWLNADDEQKARKICAMGVRCSRWVTMHGLALNVSPNLNYFTNIIPCGIKDKQITSMQAELNANISVPEIKLPFLKHFAHVFEAEFF